MTEPNEQLSRLLEKMDDLLKRHENFSKELNGLSAEINFLMNQQVAERAEEQQTEPEEIPEILEEVEAVKSEPVVVFYQPSKELEAFTQQKYSAKQGTTSNPPKSDLEKFIGENLINKIGIAITVLGVAIGAKYSIDHDLISPFTRIILGYLMGFGLLAIGFKLKIKYLNYSAVLVSGAMAIVYFITYFAYSLYELLPHGVAFSMMVIITAITVAIAIYYNRQVIAHIGMVGAYAVPFLLSGSSGKIAILLTYMAIINMGILVISFKKYWKPIFYVSFLITWIIFLSWYPDKYRPALDFELAVLFLSVFFVTFYLLFLAYKLLKGEKFDIDDVLLLLTNSFIFYAAGYSILKTNEYCEHLLGLFTLCNALIHFGVSLFVYRQRLADKALFYLVAGLAILFVTIAIPVQLEGNWVTLLWAGEAALLFWIGRIRSIQFYEKLAYALIILTFISVVHDWMTAYGTYISGKPETRIFPIFNINFLTSILVILSFGFINVLNTHQKYPATIDYRKGGWRLLLLLLPVSLLIVIYYSFRIEIATYWNQLYIDSLTKVGHPGADYFDRIQDHNLLKFKEIWIINFTLFYMAVLSFVNIRKLKRYEAGVANVLLNILGTLAFLIQGLMILNALKDSYITQPTVEYFQNGSFNIWIRYISYLFVGLTLYSTFLYTRQYFFRQGIKELKVVFDCLLHLTLLWIASSELITWMDIMKIAQSYKLVLSILWGIYALILIGLGIWKKKKYLRIGAIALFGITLYKLFFYDISDLDTIAKTIVFVSLGALLLIISFLYNKYKQIISD